MRGLEKTYRQNQASTDRYFDRVGTSSGFSVSTKPSGMVRTKLVDPKYSSQTCSECGHQAAENRPSQSSFCVKVCGYSDNADLNAAKIILTRGRGSCWEAPVGELNKQKPLWPFRPRESSLGRGGCQSTYIKWICINPSEPSFAIGSGKRRYYSNHNSIGPRLMNWNFAHIVYYKMLLSHFIETTIS